MNDLALANQIAFALRDTKLGRRSLARKTGLSEMTIRMQVNELRNLNLLSVTKSGTSLTESGRRAFSHLYDHVLSTCPLSLQSLIQDDASFGTLVTLKLQQPPWTYRDIAIQNGATSLVALTCHCRHFRFYDTSETVDEQNPVDSNTLNAFFSDRPQDAIVLITGAPDYNSARNALWYIITDLLQTNS